MNQNDHKKWTVNFKKTGTVLLTTLLLGAFAAPSFADSPPPPFEKRPNVPTSTSRKIATAGSTTSSSKQRSIVQPVVKAIRSNGKTINLSSGNLQLPWAGDCGETLPFIAHALGEVDGYALTNSKTALEQSYAKGYRVFEMDFEFTSDDILVGVHDWGNYAKSVGWEKETFHTFVIPNHKTFMQTKLYGFMEPLDLKGMLQFMLKHPDVWLITDTKAMDPSIVQRQFQQIVETAYYTDGSVLERIIPQVYTRQMHQSIQEIYPFSSYIYTLYAAAMPDDDVVRVVKETGIQTVTMPYDRAQKSLLDKLAKASAYVCVHTVNEEQEALKLKTLGVRGIYTDKLMPY